MASTNGFAGEDSLWDMSLEELAKVPVSSLATGTETPLDKAAAVVTVITEADISAMGATDLDQVLETVPGIHVGRSNQTYSPKYNIRGITAAFNAQTLVLLNGIPVTNLAFGNRGNVWAGMPVKSIQRIEVIRGPGSTLYGADAFAGVINIITKTARDINATKVGVRAGSFDTQAAWLEYGENAGDIDIAFTLEFESTDGWKEDLEIDAQSGLDSLFMTQASLAPGPVNTGKEMIESRLDIAYKNTRFRAGYQGRSNIGTGVGVAQALDPHGQFSSDRFNADFTHTLNKLSKNWGIESRISYYRNTQQVDKNVLLYPPGAFGGAFPKGFIGNPEFKEENARFDFSSVYRGFKNHLTRLGLGTYWGDVYEVSEQKNFNPDGSPKPGVEDVSDTDEVWMQEEGRTSYYLFIQDEWQLADNWQLTSGLRYDHYSDFGSTTNPRLALVWASSDNITTKLLYGRAFRPPSINVLFDNPIYLGDPDLDPEIIDTYEAAFSHAFSPDIQYSANVFYYRIKDLMTLVTVNGNQKQWQNVEERTGYGTEFEINYSPLSNLRLLANYAYQKSEDDKSNSDVGETPNHQIYARGEWEFMPRWHLQAQVNWVGEQKRAFGDTRSALDDYTTVDLTLRKLALINSLDLTLSVHNLFDEDVYEASPGPVAEIPGDFPMPGRSIYAELAYTF